MFSATHPLRTIFVVILMGFLAGILFPSIPGFFYNRIASLFSAGPTPTPQWREEKPILTKEEEATQTGDFQKEFQLILNPPSPEPTPTVSPTPVPKPVTSTPTPVK